MAYVDTADLASTDPDKGAALVARAGPSVASRVALAALDHSIHDRAYLTEPGREGMFIWDGGDLSEDVSLDTAQGVYVAPGDDATGADGSWVRQFEASVSVKWFGAKGLGASFVDGPYIQNALDFAYAKGTSVEFPANVPDYYNVRVALIWWPGVNITGVGGYAKIKNLRTDETAFMYRSIWLAGCFAINYIQDLTKYDCGTISSGTSVTLTDPLDATEFTVGQQVITASNSFSVPGSGLECADYLHLNRIVSIDSGVITLKYPIDTGYNGYIADITEITTEAGGIPEINIPLFFAENATMSFMDCEAPDGVQSIYGSAYNVKWENCIFKGRWGSIYSNAVQYCTMNNCRIYFSYKLGEFAETSLYSSVTNCKFSFYKDLDYRNIAPNPYVGFQFGEGSRYCSLSGNVIDLNEAEGPGSGQYVFGFHGAEGCEVTNNIVSGGSNLHATAFVPQSAFKCRNNLVKGNTFHLNSARSFINMVLADDTEYGNRIEDNIFRASSLVAGVDVSAILTNSHNNIVVRNTFNLGQINITGTSAGNIVTDNFVAGGFRPFTVEFGDNSVYRKNEIARITGDASLAKRAVLTETIANINAPASTTTEVYRANIGTAMRGRDVYNFTFIALASGISSPKLIKFILRDDTANDEQAIFDHAIPAASTGYVIVKSTLWARGATHVAWCETIVHDVAAGTETSYVGSFVRPADTNTLSLVLSATPGASTSLVFPRLSASVGNPFE